MHHIIEVLKKNLILINFMIQRFLQFLKAKISFSKPQKREILFFDKTGYSNLVSILKLKESQISCCCNRLEEFNLYIFFKILLRGKISYKSYLVEFINLTNPKIVITYIDNNLFFYKLKKIFPRIKFLSIQNGYRFLNDEMLATLNKRNPSRNFYSSDFYFVFNVQMKKIMEKYIDTECIVSGSLRNNHFKLDYSNNLMNGNIGFISRFTPAILKSLEKKDEKNPNFIVHNFSSKLICNVAKYCKKNNKKLMILTTQPHLLEKEKKYYSQVLGSYNFDYLYKKGEYDSYSNLYKVDLLISPSSTLGSEALGRNLKVLTFSDDKILGSNFGWPFIHELEGIFFSNNYKYENVEKKIDQIYNLSDEKWKKLLADYSDYTCFVDEDNQILKNKIDEILK